MPQIVWSDEDIVALARSQADLARSRLERWLEIDPDDLGVEWAPRRWAERVPIVSLPTRLCEEGRIRRRDLLRLGEEAATTLHTDSLVALLVGVMAWGCGLGIRRDGVMQGDARGPWKAEQALAIQPSGVPSGQNVDRIRMAVILTRKEGAKAAYEALSSFGSAKLPQMDESFFTKLIYAMGYGCNTAPRPWPLVLDDRVRRALVRRGGILAHEEWTLYRNSTAYRQYLLIAETWSQLWSTPADRVEYALFRLGETL